MKATQPRVPIAVATAASTVTRSGPLRFSSPFVTAVGS